MYRHISLLLILSVFLTKETHAFKIPGISYPFHASCKIKWTFPSTECNFVKDKLIEQIELWNHEDCKSGQKCLYALLDKEDDKLKATHTTPKKRYVDDLKFEFDTKGDDCQVEGFSTSRAWYALLDFGTNYCNLHNLIIGSGLDKLDGYVEITKDKICTQYSSADCEKY